MTVRRGMGLVKQPPDYRDYSFATSSVVLRVGLPDIVDLRGDAMPKIRDQSQLGSCTAHAGTAVVEYVERYDHDPDHDALSRLWTYYWTRVAEGNRDSDSGATIRGTFKTLANRGAPRERYWPYSIDRFADEPDAGERSAPHHRVLEYRAVREGSELDMRGCLAEGYPFAYGFAVYSSFFDVGADGWWRPQPGEDIEGYHAVVCVGYDFAAAEPYWVVRNSWGAGWGADGYFKVPRRYLSVEAFDMWTVRRVSVDP